MSLPARGRAVDGELLRLRHDLVVVAMSGLRVEPLGLPLRASLELVGDVLGMAQQRCGAVRAG